MEAVANLNEKIEQEAATSNKKNIKKRLFHESLFWKIKHIVFRKRRQKK